MNKQADTDKDAEKIDLQSQNVQTTFDSGQECVPLNIFARIKHQEYMALLAAGFTEQQALFLVKPN